jgi:hypothetical protein
MSDASETYQSADCFHHVVRSFSARFIDDQDSVERQWLYFSGHTIISEFRPAIAPA